MNRVPICMMTAFCGVATALVVGCSRQTPSLDEEIAALTTTWTGFKTIGASSNKWALLERVASVENADEKTRLVKTLYVRMRSTPEEILAHDRHDNFYIFNEKMNFARSCAWTLISDTNDCQTAAREGWRLEASWIDDLERLIALTESDWHAGVYDEDAPPPKREAWAFASRVRRIYELYFKYSFCVAGTYRRLPETVRHAFVEQIKRDFFHRKGMSLVDLAAFPPAFRK